MSFILLGILNSQAAGAGGAGAYDLLESTVLTSSASSVSFTGLDSYTDYKHLQIRYTGQSILAGNTGLDNLQINFNSSSGTYQNHFLRGTGSVVESGSQSFSYINIIQALTRSGATNIFSPVIIDILDFSSANKNTTVRALTGGLTSSETAVALQSGLWVDTSAVTSVELTNPNARDFATDSRFSLYGIR